jgi:hypothetical protein
MSDKKKKKSKSLDHLGSTLGILPFVRKNKKNVSDSEMKEMIESFQNDRTRGLPQEAYEQEDQSISYEAPKMNMGGEMVRGMGKAVKGFKKVIIR